MNSCAIKCCRGQLRLCFSSPTWTGRAFAAPTSSTIIDSRRSSSGQKSTLASTGRAISSRTAPISRWSRRRFPNATRNQDCLQQLWRGDCNGECGEQGWCQGRNGDHLILLLALRFAAREPWEIGVRPARLPDCDSGSACRREPDSKRESRQQAHCGGNSQSNAVGWIVGGCDDDHYRRRNLRPLCPAAEP